MSAYHRSDLAGDLEEDLTRAIAALQDGHIGIALGVLCGLRDGPYPLEPLTVAVRVCGCGQLLGTDEWIGDDAHKGETHTITHGMCDPCLSKTESQCRAYHERETT